MKPFIGLEKIWYGAPLKAEPESYAAVTTLITGSGFTEVTNVHDGTWAYTQDDPTITEYINMLSGQPYYREITNAGNKTMAFTMGQYTFDDLVALQGGEAVGTDGWKAGAPKFINQCVIAKTKSGNYIVFTNAGVVAKTGAAEQNLGLAVTAVAMDNETKGIAPEYRFAAPETNA